MQNEVSNTLGNIFEDIQCRLCLSAGGDVQPLFPPGEKCVMNDLLSRVFDCLNIHVTFLEDFCSVICMKCQEKVNSFYNFKKQCQTNDDYLRGKRNKAGAEFERMQRADMRDLQMVNNVDIEQQVVKEPDDETLLNQAEQIFFPTSSSGEKTLVEYNNPSHSNKQVQTSEENSSEPFCGFSLDHRRSPRIFIKKSEKEAFERQSSVSASLDKTKRRRLSSEVLDIKADLNASLSPIQKKNIKPTLFYDGFQYARPKEIKNGATVWACSSIPCQARLVKDKDGKMSLNDESHQHRPQVEQDRTIFNVIQKKTVPYILAHSGRQRSFIYNDSFVYYFRRDLPAKQSMWICQRDGCKASVRISDSFKRITCIAKHNHTESKIVCRHNEKMLPKREKHVKTSKKA